MTEPSQLTNASWQDRVFVTITRKEDGTSWDFHGLLNEIGFSGGESDFEGDPLMNGGRVRRRSAQTDHEFTGTLYPVGAGAGDGTSRPEGIHELVYGGENQLTVGTEGHEYGVTHERDDFRIAVMWTDDPDVSTALDAVDNATDNANSAYRKVMRDAYITMANLNFDDQILTLEFTAKASPYDEEGRRLVYVQSCDEGDTAGLPAIRDDSSSSIFTDAADQYDA